MSSIEINRIKSISCLWPFSLVILLRQKYERSTTVRNSTPCSLLIFLLMEQPRLVCDCKVLHFSDQIILVTWRIIMNIKLFIFLIYCKTVTSDFIGKNCELAPANHEFQECLITYDELVECFISTGLPL